MENAWSKREFDDLDVLALGLIAAAGRDSFRVVILGNEEEELFRDRTGAHIQLEELPWRTDAKSGLFFNFPADSRFRVFGVEQACARFQEHSIPQAVDERRIAELTREDEGSRCGIDKQNDCSVTTIVGFPAYRLPTSVRAPEIKRGLLQKIPIVGENSDVTNAYAISSSSIAPAHRSSR